MLCINFTRYGKCLSSGSTDGSVTFWDLSLVNDCTVPDASCSFVAHCDVVNGCR